MQLMVENDKWELYIPSELGYGDRGSPPKIPGGAVLVFQMELLKILAKDESEMVPALKCDFSSKENCNEKEVAYISKIGAWEDTKQSSEKARLKKILDDAAGTLKSDLEGWMRRRLHILKQVVPDEPVSTTEGEEL